MTQEVTGAAADTAPQPARLNLRLLRQAVHGWWLGHPLVEVRPPATVQGMVAVMVGRGTQTGAVVLQSGEARAGGGAGGIVVAVLLPGGQLAEDVVALASEVLAAVASERFAAEVAVVSPGVVQLADGYLAHLTLIPGERLATLLLDLSPATSRVKCAGVNQGQPWDGRREELIAGWLRRLNLRLVAHAE